VKWSPAGNKFAVGSGAKCVPICQFEERNDWWISKMIKKHSSTVLSLAWCCNNKFIVTGACDNKCRVFSAYVAGLDSAEDDGFGEVWAKQHEFGELLCEFDANAWVNAVAWSPNAFRLSFATHASSISFVQILAGSKPIVQTLALKGLPFLETRFLTDNAVVAAGYDNAPYLFSASGSDAEPKWAYTDILDKEDKKTAPTSAAPAQSATKSALKTFQDATARGITASSSQKKDTQAPAAPEKTYRHSNAICCLYTQPNADGAPITTFWTSGLDGRVLFWDTKKLGVTLT
jgi:actin related protein 2/3 complex subunit 1A/1B